MRLAAILVFGAVALACSPWSGSAQEARVVLPGDPLLDPAGLRPFEAEYEQVGYPFFTRLVKTSQARPVLSFQMIMEGPDGVGIDHVGHHADDLSFAYRRFTFGAFGPEYIDARARDGDLRLRRVPLGGEGVSEASTTTVTLERDVMDGTFSYWMAGALPLEIGLQWRWHTWRPTADGVELRETPVFRVVSRETLTTADGRSFDAWVVTVDAATSFVRMWVVDEPPYLIRQDVAESADSEPRTVIVLKRLRPR